MAVTNQNFTIFQRSDYILRYTITDDDGNPQDCTGAAFEFDLTCKNTNVETLSLNSDDSPTQFTVSGENSDTVDVNISEENLDIGAGVYRHELRLRDVFGNTAPVATGTVNINVSRTNVF